jgi:hypothetical protein
VQLRACVGQFARSTLYTDEWHLLTRTGEEYAAHKTTKHSAGGYARHEFDVVGIRIRSKAWASVFKRGMVGVYQHCGEAHLHRYLAEFDFRYNRRAALQISHAERAVDLLRSTPIRCLTYRGLVDPITPKQKAAAFLRWRKK